VDQDSQTQPTPVPTTPVSPQAAPAWTPDPPAMPANAPVAAPVTAKQSARRGPSGRVLNVILAGALVLAVSGIAFAAGRMTAPVAAAIGPGNFPGAGQLPNGYFGGRQGGQGGGAFAGAGGGGVSLEGTVDSISATTLTLKLASGQTIQIALDPTTTYHAQTNASSSDVVSGGKVQVQLSLGRGAGAESGVSGTTARDITVVP
jgi:hypothetical protein